MGDDEEKSLSRYKLIKEYKISTGQLDRLRKNGNVSTYTLDQLCQRSAGRGRQKKGDPLVYALVTKDGVEWY